MPAQSVKQTTLLRGQLLKLLKSTTVDLVGGGSKHWMDIGWTKTLFPRCDKHLNIY